MDIRTVFCAHAEEKEENKSEMTANTKNRRIKTSFQERVVIHSYIKSVPGCQQELSAFPPQFTFDPR
jgi:hypothetical protein